MAKARDPRGIRAQKLTYLGVGIGVALSVFAPFLPTNYQWFLWGVATGVILFCVLLLSNLFWRGQY
jgi:hypothetical protein